MNHPKGVQNRPRKHELDFFSKHYIWEGISKLLTTSKQCYTLQWTMCQCWPTGQNSADPTLACQCWANVSADVGPALAQC